MANDWSRGHCHCTSVRALLGYFAATPNLLQGEDVRGRSRGGIFLSLGEDWVEYRKRSPRADNWEAMSLDDVVEQQKCLGKVVSENVTRWKHKLGFHSRAVM